MKGMTGFGRARVDNGQYEAAVEISSVNKRSLDISIRLQREYQQVEGSVRRELAKRVFRGQVSVSISVRPLAAAGGALQIDWSAADSRFGVLQTICDRYSCPVPAERAALELWRDLLENAERHDEPLPEVEELILRAVEAAFVLYDRQRADEGVFIGKDIGSRLLTLREMKNEIAQKVDGQVEQIRQRLTDLVRQQVPALASDDRVLREVVLYADKSDVSEELSRIDHHLNHMEKILLEPSPVGKLMEFVLQELLRELNTLGAKNAVAAVASTVALAKTELEKIREQVQNVE